MECGVCAELMIEIEKERVVCVCGYVCVRICVCAGVWVWVGKSILPVLRIETAERWEGCTRQHMHKEKSSSE